MSVHFRRKTRVRVIDLLRPTALGRKYGCVRHLPERLRYPPELISTIKQLSDACYFRPKFRPAISVVRLVPLVHNSFTTVLASLMGVVLTQKINQRLGTTMIRAAQNRESPTDIDKYNPDDPNSQEFARPRDQSDVVLQWDAADAVGMSDEAVPGWRQTLRKLIECDERHQIGDEGEMKQYAWGGQGQCRLCRPLGPSPTAQRSWALIR